MIFLSKAAERRMVDQGKSVVRLIFPGVKRHNLKDVGLGPLGRLDHATLEAGMVVPMHPHQQDEILSYVRRGVLLHKDGRGSEVPVHSTHMMLLNAGSGLQHEEAVPDNSEPVEMLQIYIRPEADNLPPQVQFHAFDTAYSMNGWRLLGGAHDAPLQVRSDIRIYDARVEAGQLATPALQGRTGFLYVFDGEASLVGKNVPLHQGDALIVQEEQLQIHAASTADLVFFVINEAARYSRSGRFSG